MKYRSKQDPASIVDAVQWCRTERRNAHGRLMAAAKELYDAPVATRKALQEPGPYTELIADLTKAIAKAIAKADQS